MAPFGGQRPDSPLSSSSSVLAEHWATAMETQAHGSHRCDDNPVGLEPRAPEGSFLAMFAS